MRYNKCLIKLLKEVTIVHRYHDNLFLSFNFRLGDTVYSVFVHRPVLYWLDLKYRRQKMIINDVEFLGNLVQRFIAKPTQKS